ncbi:MAG: serine hydrolase [Aquimarina sp.]|nr:serine hydrolase [Aquimarina sp.]
MIKNIYVGAIIYFAITLQLNAQVSQDSQLFKDLKQHDSIFFEKGFNQCDISYLQEVIAKDLRFFHDQSGVQYRDDFFKSTKENLCSDFNKKPIRKLKPGSLEVFPLYNNGNLYGAIQKGVHHFYIREKEKEDRWTSTAKFTSVWTLKDERWILTEVLSYDHQNPNAIVTGSPKNEIESLLREHKVPALGLGIIKNGTLKEIKVYGTLDGEREAPYNTIFKVASLTKPIVALTTLKLVDNGLLSLDEPLYTYWIDPDVVDDKRYKKLTPRIVLTHQTGFPNWRYLNDDNTLAFEFDPGSKHQYSGEGFEYLRKAVEKKTGKTIEELAEQYVFKSIGMRDTRFWWDESMDESMYALNFDKEGKPLKTIKYYEANAAANLLTTVEDYSKFIAYLINGAELNPKLFEEMLEPQVKLGEKSFFGLGWEILSDFSGGEKAILHTGKDPGVSTLAIFFPKSKNGYVVFLNGDNSMPVYEKLLNDYLYMGEELWLRK